MIAYLRSPGSWIDRRTHKLREAVRDRVVKKDHLARFGVVAGKVGEGNKSDARAVGAKRYGPVAGRTYSVGDLRITIRHCVVEKDL